MAEREATRFLSVISGDFGMFGGDGKFEGLSEGLLVVTWDGSSYVCAGAALQVGDSVLGSIVCIPEKENSKVEGLKYGSMTVDRVVASSGRER